MHQFKTKYPASLFTTGGNVKVSKGESIGVTTAIMHLQPDDDTCPNKGNCGALCLVQTGRLRFDKNTAARVRKTDLWRNEPAWFLDRMRRDMRSLLAKCKRTGSRPAARPNGTSDIAFEETGIMQEFPEIQFYDYTKSPHRMRRFLAGKLPDNYYLTFSHDGPTNVKACLEVLHNGGNVAVCFRVKKGDPLPAQWNGFQVIDGDIHDVRFMDQFDYPAGVVVGLRAKGRKAKEDRSGFTVDPDYTVDAIAAD